MAENPRPAAQAAIKRATKAAQRAMDTYDGQTLDDLTRIYSEASAAIQEQIARFSGADTVQIHVLQDLLAQVKSRLNLLTTHRDQLLDTGLLHAANLGAQPFASASTAGVMAVSVTNAAHDAVQFVRNFVAADGLQLSDRIWRLDKNAQQAVANAIESAVIQGHSASQAAAEFLARGQAVPGDIARKMAAARTDKIQQAAGRALMVDDGNAYENAKRLFRTELNRAHGTAYLKSVEAHPDTVGTRFLLSPAHPRADICDMHAQVNRYGLGPGVYPPGKNPWPAHPNTLSYTEVVFSDEVSAEDRAGKIDRISWLNMQPARLQQSVLGFKKAQILRAGHLGENAISTPWHVIKQRLDSKGIRIDLDIKSANISNLPDPPKIIASGSPVSDALNPVGYKNISNHVLSIIDSVHGDGRLPKIPIKRTSSNRYFGAYTRIPALDQAVNISLSSAGSNKDHTLAHEIGHFIDHKGLPGTGMSSEGHPIMQEWFDAVQSSQSVKSITNMRDKVSSMSLARSSKSRMLAHLDYLLRRREIWARSYAQYITLKSGDSVLASQLKETLNPSNQGDLGLVIQWEEADFLPIAKAIDNLMEKMGWIK